MEELKIAASLSKSLQKQIVKKNLKTNFEKKNFEIAISK